MAAVKRLLNDNEREALSNRDRGPPGMGGWTKSVWKRLSSSSSSSGRWRHSPAASSPPTPPRPRIFQQDLHPVAHTAVLFRKHQLIYFYTSAPLTENPLGLGRLLASMPPGPPGSATPWPARLREPERLRYWLVGLAALPDTKPMPLL